MFKWITDIDQAEKAQVEKTKGKNVMYHTYIIGNGTIFPETCPKETEIIASFSCDQCQQKNRSLVIAKFTPHSTCQNSFCFSSTSQLPRP